MACLPFGLGEAGVAEEGVVGAGEFCADVSGSFFAVEEAEDGAGGEGVVFLHLCANLNELNINPNK